MAPHPMPRIRLGCTDVSTAVVNVSCLPCEHTCVNNLIFDEKGDNATKRKRDYINAWRNKNDKKEINKNNDQEMTIHT
jgi:hypothetical protein